MKIRIAEKQDAGQILDIYAPYVQNTSISFETTVPTKAEMEKRIENVLAYYPWIVIEEDGSILGYAYASRYHERDAYRWSVDVSIYLRQDCRGKGIGKALYSALIPILKLQGFYNAYAVICLPNEASVGIHEYFGFRKVAHFSNVGYKLDQWRDVGWWELHIRHHGQEPEEPIPFSRLDKEEVYKVLYSTLENPVR